VTRDLGVANLSVVNSQRPTAEFPVVARTCQISGRVQMVGFRAFVMGRARRLGVVGWVHNLPDGSVEALIQGPQSALDKLQLSLARGPAAAQVNGMVVLDVAPSSELCDFSLVP